MAKIEITKRSVVSLEPGPKDQFLWGTVIIGFGCKVTPSGRKVFILQYRDGCGGRASPTRRLTFGVFGNITVAHARRLALQAHTDLADGKDPAELKRRAAEARLGERRLSSMSMMRRGFRPVPGVVVPLAAAGCAFVKNY